MFKQRKGIYTAFYETVCVRNKNNFVCIMLGVSQHALLENRTRNLFLIVYYASSSEKSSQRNFVDKV